MFQMTNLDVWWSALGLILHLCPANLVLIRWYLMTPHVCYNYQKWKDTNFWKATYSILDTPVHARLFEDPGTDPFRWLSKLTGEVRTIKSVEAIVCKIWCVLRHFYTHSTDPGGGSQVALIHHFCSMDRSQNMETKLKDGNANLFSKVNANVSEKQSTKMSG